MSSMNIIEYLSGLTAFVFDKSVLQRVALDRGVLDVEDVSTLDTKTRDLLKADLFYVAYLSPNVWASSKNQHGSFSQSIGGQTLSASDKERLYNFFTYIYKKYDDEMLSEVLASDSTLQWINVLEDNVY